jgi:hypothetical protein
MGRVVFIRIDRSRRMKCTDDTVAPVEEHALLDGWSPEVCIHQICNTCWQTEVSLILLAIFHTLSRMVYCRIPLLCPGNTSLSCPAALTHCNAMSVIDGRGEPSQSGQIRNSCRSRAQRNDRMKYTCEFSVIMPHLKFRSDITWRRRSFLRYPNHRSKADASIKGACTWRRRDSRTGSSCCLFVA